MACHRNSPGTEDLCYGGAQQSFRYDAWTGIECQYGLALFWVYQSCGFINKGVTSLQKELGKEVPMEEVIERLKQALCTLLS